MNPRSRFSQSIGREFNFNPKPIGLQTHRLDEIGTEDFVTSLHVGEINTAREIGEHCQ